MAGADMRKFIRKQALSRRDALDPLVRERFSAQIAGHIQKSAAYRAARTVFLYIPMRSEVDLSTLLMDEEKQILLPVTLPHGGMEAAPYQGMDQLVRHPFGMLEPQGEAWVDPKDIDLVLVPGAAFDRFGGRMGYGGGYYDRFLPRLRLDTPKIGVAFSTQVLEDRLMQSPHDVCMDAIVTENGIAFFTA